VYKTNSSAIAEIPRCRVG